MPTKPQWPCRFPGCPNRAIPGRTYCDEHFKQTERARRKRLEGDECEAFYHTRTWQIIRRAVLEQEPLCRSCKEMGRFVPATVVDHIVPIRQGGDKMSMDNLQPLCASCHERKSIEEGSRW